jgi:hypothetical protein
MKAIKAWAIVDEKGRLMKVQSHVLLRDCPFAIYDNNDVLEHGCKYIRVEIREVEK